MVIFIQYLHINYVSKFTVSYFLIQRGSLVVKEDSKIYTQHLGLKGWATLVLENPQLSSLSLWKVLSKYLAAFRVK